MKKVLFQNHNNGLLTVAKIHLRGVFDAVLVHTLEEVRQALETSKPDVVILYDSGKLERLQETIDTCFWYEVPVILTSANEEREELAKAGFELGKNLISSAYDFEDLIQLINNLVS